jgi:plastocyanin
MENLFLQQWDQRHVTKGGSLMSKARKLLLALGSTATVLAALSCGGGGYSSPTAPTSGPKTVTIAVKDDLYDPKSVTINPGDTVQWVMQGSDHGHTVTAVDGSFDSGAVFTSTGAMYTRTFSQANVTINYSCKVHSSCCGMKGSILVGAGAPPPAGGYAVRQ